MNTHEIRLEQDHAAASAEVIAALVASNERQVGPRNTYHFTLSIRDDHGGLLGGLVGEIYWTCLYVAVLWIHDSKRGQGFGRRLLSRAEQMARNHGCAVAFLNTMTFQAPDFYKKCGYAEFGALPWTPEPLVRHWFAKRLSKEATARE